MREDLAGKKQRGLGYGPDVEASLFHKRLQRFNPFISNRKFGIDDIVD
ncbi:hypothetical protein RLEG12_04480 (plasmid) [Rhizobium leguminosarum bv. trifolii CB782]|nr:hypothetical protein RLEG12_04480 [Rhizobium leguminosarum bv. trifolii CB782]